jgi:hypothetical protein
MGRFVPVCFYQKPTISRQASFGEMLNAAERQKLGGMLPFNFGPL